MHIFIYNIQIYLIIPNVASVNIVYSKEKV